MKGKKMSKKLLQTFPLIIFIMALNVSDSKAQSYCCADWPKVLGNGSTGQSISGDGVLCRTHPDHPYPVPFKTYCRGVTMRGDCQNDRPTQFRQCCVLIAKGTLSCM